MPFDRNVFELKLGHRGWKAGDLIRELRATIPRDFMPTESAVYQWCSGTRNPSTKYLKYIAKVLGCKVDNLIK